MTLQEIKALIENSLSNISDFKEFSFDYIPPPTMIKKFPALSSDFVDTTLSRYSGTCTFKAKTLLDIYVYNRLLKNRTNTPTLDLVDKVNKQLQTDPNITDNTIDVFVKNIMSDGGVVLPIQVYRITVEIEHFVVNDYT